MKKISDYEFELSTGKTLRAYKGIFGINEELTEIFEGYDGIIHLTEYDFETEANVPLYTPEEITEICDYAINLWTQLKDKYTPRNISGKP